jgi:putative isomerase
MALDRNPVTREYYDSQTGLGYGMNPFWGWSSLAYVMPLDLEMHYDPMDLGGTIRPLITEQWGVRLEEESAAKP